MSRLSQEDRHSSPTREHQQGGRHAVQTQRQENKHKYRDKDKCKYRDKDKCKYRDKGKNKDKYRARKTKANTNTKAKTETAHPLGNTSSDVKEHTMLTGHLLCCENTKKRKDTRAPPRITRDVNLSVGEKVNLYQVNHPSPCQLPKTTLITHHCTVHTSDLDI